MKKTYRLTTNLREPHALLRGHWPRSGRALPTGVTMRIGSAPSASRRARFKAAPELDLGPDADVQAHVRAISAVLVPGHCMDHSAPAPLKDAIARKLFEKRPIYSNHWTDPTRSLGYMDGAEWDETLLGKAQAPGVNVYVSIDSSLSEDSRVIGRGISMGYLSRWSIGFQAEYVASHPDEMDGWDDYAWWKLLGTPSPHDGEIYRLICTAIVDVFELSIVDVGAIESARTLTDETSLRAPAPKPAPPAIPLALPLPLPRTETQR